jgi:hypothetical protein
MFDGPDAASPVADAFRLYRDYDGAGARFGDTYVQSTSEDQGRVAVYGATRASDGALTVAVVNKATTAQTSTLSLAGFTPGGPAQVWQSTGAGITRKPDAAVGGGALTADLPARSMTLLVVPAGAAGPGGGGGGGGGTGPGGGGDGTTPGTGTTQSLSHLKATTNKDGSVTLTVDVPAAGKLGATATVGGGKAPRAAKVRTIARGSASAHKAGRVTLRIKPTSSGRSYIRRHKKGVRAAVKLTFKPTTGTTLRRSTRATFRIKRR